jgi:hypothetical protein
MTDLLDSVTSDWWCTVFFLVFPSLIAMALKWFWTAYVSVGPFSSSISCFASARQS